MDTRTERLRAWIDIESISGNERAFLEELEIYLSARGFTVDRQPVGIDRWNVIAARRPNPSLVYCTHVDTVPPFFPARVEREAVYGRGACDTKGGIVAMIEAGERLLADGLDDLGYLFVVGEEVDHDGARTAVDLDLRPERIVLCEPTDNRVVRAQKGMVKLTLTTEGVAGHSAYPDQGHSAVHDLLDALADLRRHEWPVDEVLGPTTMNVGVIEGGVAANVFAARARAEVMIRAVSDSDALVRTIHELVGDRAVVEVPAANDPVFFDPPEDVDTCLAAFNTDATYLQELGPVWLVGPGDIEVAHSVDEHITLASMQAGVDLYERLGRSVLAPR